MGKLKITIRRKEAPTSQLVRTLLLGMLEAVILQADRLVCVDRGHRHATTNISEVSIWLSPIGAQEVEVKEKAQEKENDSKAEEPMAAAEITTADEAFHAREPGQADNETAEQDDNKAATQAGAPDEPAKGEPDAELAGGSESSSSEAKEDEGSNQHEHSDVEAKKEEDAAMREEGQLEHEEEGSEETEQSISEHDESSSTARDEPAEPDDAVEDTQNASSQPVTSSGSDDSDEGDNYSSDTEWSDNKEARLMELRGQLLEQNRATLNLVAAILTKVLAAEKEATQSMLQTFGGMRVVMDTMINEAKGLQELKEQLQVAS